MTLWPLWLLLVSWRAMGYLLLLDNIHCDPNAVMPTDMPGHVLLDVLEEIPEHCTYIGIASGDRFYVRAETNEVVTLLQYRKEMGKYVYKSSTVNLGPLRHSRCRFRDSLSFDDETAQYILHETNRMVSEMWPSTHHADVCELWTEKSSVLLRLSDKHGLDIISTIQVTGPTVPLNSNQFATGFFTTEARGQMLQLPWTRGNDYGIGFSFVGTEATAEVPGSILARIKIMVYRAMLDMTGTTAGWQRTDDKAVRTISIVVDESHGRAYARLRFPIPLFNEVETVYETKMVKIVVQSGMPDQGSILVQKRGTAKTCTVDGHDHVEMLQHIMDAIPRIDIQTCSVKSLDEGYQIQLVFKDGESYTARIHTRHDDTIDKVVFLSKRLND